MGVTAANRIARLQENGALDTTFNVGTGASDRVITIDTDDAGRIYAGGWFTTFHGANFNKTVRLNSDGSTDPTFTAPTRNFEQVNAIEPLSESLFLEGYSSNGGSPNGFAIFSDSGAVATNYFSGRGFYVKRTIQQPDGRILVAGYFDYVNEGVPRMGLARFNLDGSLDARSPRRSGSR